MTITDALSSGKIAKSDAEILLAALLRKDRTWILAHGDYALQPYEAERWDKWEERRADKEPVAYITGQQEFYGRMLIVNPHTLVPRPATEKLVEIALSLLGNGSQPMTSVTEIDAEITAVVNIWKPLARVHIAADIGTGSGCIAVTLARENPALNIYATDINPETLVTAKKNASMYGVANRVTFLEGKNLEPLRGIIEPFLIVSNPPYIPAATALEKDVADFEPHTALFAGERGMDVLSEIASQAKAHPYCCGFVMECRNDQSEFLL